MYSYSAFGLGIQSDLRLPELAQGDATSDICIHVDQSALTPDQIPGQSRWIQLSQHEAALYMKDIALIRLRAGREVVVSPAPGVRESILRLCLLGPIIGALLYQRGNLVLHASVIHKEGQAIAVMADSGWGKSSLAAALVRRGYDLVTDDVTAIELAGEVPTVLRGPPRMKIAREVADQLNIPDHELFVIDPLVSKKEWQVQRRLARLHVPLQRIYVLGLANAVHVLPLHPQEVVIELVRNSYPTRVKQPGGALHLQQCAQLASQVPFARLHRTGDITALPLLADIVEQELNCS